MTFKPFFSIIIPTYNRPEKLKDCLEAIAQLDYPRDCFEVVVVDDGSSQPLNDLITPFQDQLSIQLIRQENSGPATARNTGAKYAKGEFLAFTDDDCQPMANWLQAFAQKFEEFPESLLGGYTINQLTDNPYSEASQLLIDYIYSYYNTNRDRASFFASNNFALAKTLFDKLGGFDVTFPLAAAEDREFCDRCSSYGYPLIYVPEARIYHSHRLHSLSFWRQHFNYGRGAFQFHQMRAKKSLERIKVEPFSFYINLVIYPLLRKQSKLEGLFLSGLFCLSQVANLTGFFWESYRNRDFLSFNN
jgi:glycosyltransferase involved in cell wall biosynthesis